MFGLGVGEIVLILVIALVLLGPKKLPELATNIGKGLREFNRARQGIMDQIERPLAQGLQNSQDSAAASRPSSPEQEQSSAESSSSASPSTTQQSPESTSDVDGPVGKA